MTNANTAAKNAHCTIAAAHFAKASLRALTKAGFVLLGTTTIPNRETGEFSNGETGYQVSHQGRGRVMGRFELLAAAGDEKAAKVWARINTNA